MLFDFFIRPIDFKKVKELGILGEEDFLSYRQMNIIREYLVNTIGIYGENLILNDLDFVNYDIENREVAKEKSLEERKIEFEKIRHLTKPQREQYKDISLLESRIKGLDISKGEDLLKRLGNIKSDPVKNIEELESIYSDYEIAFREEIVDELYIPQEQYTLVTNFKDIKTHLVHFILFDLECVRPYLEKKLKKKIIDKYNYDKATIEEKEKAIEEFNIRKSLIDAQLDPLQTNYSFDDSDFLNTDYYTDTTNQISGIILSEPFFLTNTNLIGVGFNKNGLDPEAIALSSAKMLVTVRGLNNLEIDDTMFSTCSANLKDLKEAEEGLTEIVMFRRGLDFDTIGQYIFATIDSSDYENSNEILKLIKEYQEKSNLPVVIYDTYKIKESFNEFLRENGLEHLLETEETEKDENIEIKQDEDFELFSFLKLKIKRNKKIVDLVNEKIQEDDGFNKTKKSKKIKPKESEHMKEL